MSKRDWKLFVEDVLECIGKIDKYIENIGFEDFKDDAKTVDAVVRNLEIIGEACKHVPEDVKEAHQDIYWKGIVGIRNRIIHEYFGVDSKIIWHIIKKELPTVREQIEHILREDKGRS